MFEIIVRQGQYSFVFCSRGYEAFNSDGMISFSYFINSFMIK